MAEEKKTNKTQGTVESFVEIFRVFGQAVGEVFDDPQLRNKAREFADSAANSARTLVDRFKDEDVQARFKEVGKAAEEFGKNVAEIFKNEKKE